MKSCALLLLIPALLLAGCVVVKVSSPTIRSVQKLDTKRPGMPFGKPGQ